MGRARRTAILIAISPLLWSLIPAQPFTGTTGSSHGSRQRLTRRVARAWGRLAPEDRRKPGGGAEHLGEFLYEMVQLTPCRYSINGLAIMEATSDMRAGRSIISLGQSPKGKTILSMRSQDGSFQLKLDADALAVIELEEREQGAAHFIRFLDGQGRRHLSAVMLGDDAEARFQIMLGRWTSRVSLQR